jgi:hypothetical protein
MIPQYDLNTNFLNSHHDDNVCTSKTIKKRRYGRRRIVYLNKKIEKKVHLHIFHK